MKNLKKFGELNEKSNVTKIKIKNENKIHKREFVKLKKEK